MIDALGGQLDYHYDAQGNLRFVTRGAELETEVRYDRLGRKRYMNDPDKGEWHYAYNAFGDLIEQTDAKGQRSVMKYDDLGRRVERRDYLASTVLEGQSNWHYNNSQTWQAAELENPENNASWRIPPGALIKVEASDGYRQAQGYDNLGRPSVTATSFMVSGRTENYFARTTYDGIGRVHQEFDAGGDGSWRDQGIEHRYNDYGYLREVVDAVQFNGAPRSRYYQVLEMDLRGNVTRSQQGNSVTTQRSYDPATGRLQTQRADLFNGLFGELQDQEYTWDELGNLLHRYDYSGDESLREDFGYDDLNRLEWSQVGNRDRVTLDYDAWGNIRHKSDVGDYRYGAECQQGAGPPALCETSDGQRYWYDANGSMVGDSSGRRIEYSSFDKPTVISKDGHTTRFAYNPNRARYLRSDEDRHGATTLTRYLGNVERITHPDGRLEIKRRLPGGALISYTQSAGGQPAGKTTHYLHMDHLGSLDTISDEMGQLVAQMSFDAWGQRRNARDWDALVEEALRDFDPGITDITKRGFTGHEMLDEVGLIHMNGRIYDPRLGRFMQADPMIQFPSDTQSYNRYSYAHNNPLKYTDSSGYGLDVFDALKVVVGVVAFVYTWDPSTLAWALGSIGGVQAAYNGGDIGQVAIAAFSGAVSGYLGGSLINGMDFGSYIGWSALSGGITAELQGGKFGHGFVSAGIGAASGGITKGISNIYVRAAVGTIVGGTLSEATGGKFANGATTAAFAHLFSAMARNGQKKEAPGRALTADEITEAESVFGDKIDYSKVRIIDGKYVPFQGDDYVMAPDGNIYWPGECGNLASCGGVGTAGVFIHEMTHVMQHQHGVNVLGRGLLLQSAKFLSLGLYDPYQFNYDPNRSFSSYNIEQQGDYARGEYFGRYPNSIDY